MKLKQISTWKAAADKSSIAVQFVVTLTDGAIVARFCGRSDELVLSDDDGTERACLPGLVSNLSAMEISADPRTPGNPMPSLPPLRFDQGIISEKFGLGDKFPQNVSTLRVEIALVCESLSWDDRIVIISGARVNPTAVDHLPDGTVSFSLLDPLETGKVLLPRNVVDTDDMPAAWLTAIDGEVRIQTNFNGAPFPICYGTIFRARPMKIFDDGGGTNSDEAQPIRRYIIAAGRVAATTATLHRASSTIPIGYIDTVAGATKSEYCDLTKTILEAETQDGFLFSYVETDGSAVPAGELNGEEDPTLSPPKEVQAISFDATTGEEATLGHVIRDMIRRWTDIEIDDGLNASMADVVHEFRSVPVSITIDGEGSDRATVAEILDQRFSGSFPIGTARVGGSLRLMPFMHLMIPPGSGYQDPSVELSIGDECSLEGSIRESGEIFNAFEVRYKMRGDDGAWDALPLLFNSDTDGDAAVSEGRYGRREAPVVELYDVVDSAGAGAVLSFLRAVHLEPWFETRLSCPIYLSWLLPGDKVRMRYGGEPGDTQEERIGNSCTRNRSTLASDLSNSWRDAIVTSIRYGDNRFGVTVIF